MRLFLVLLCCATCVLSQIRDNSVPRVVIVGSGPAGTAAASRLLDNGFTDVTILEAENRTGGRVYSIEFGDYILDMGGQWVHGEKNNVAFELAWPLGLIERFDETYNVTLEIFGSTGSSLPREMSHDLMHFYPSIEGNIDDIENLQTGSLGEHVVAIAAEFFKAHPEISADLHKPILYMMELTQMGSNGADTWFNISAKGIRDDGKCDGDQNLNWKNRTYSTILDILMKKYPNPEEELPVLNNTHTSTKVTKIEYNGDTDPIKISTANGKEYLADHVIFTPSLGVLKANYEHLFNPPLPEKKVTSIKNLGFGHVGKIWLYYENPWWDSAENKYESKHIYWTEADRKEIESDPKKSWMLGIVNIFPTEHKPKALMLWMSSYHATEMELIPEELFRNQTLELINRFFGHEYNITQPTEIRRTMWNTNENFLGTYSYRGTQADAANISSADLAEPIMHNNKPILQFAGEATSEHYSTVHGAIDSGWREADRLINLYSIKKNPSP